MTKKNKLFTSTLLLIIALSSSCATKKVPVVEEKPVQNIVPESQKPALEPQPQPEPEIINEEQPQVQNQPATGESYQTFDNEEKIAEADKKVESQVEEVEVKDRVFFDYDSSSINNSAKEILDIQATWLNSETSIKIMVEGHCDERGTREYNIALGEKRANSVKKYLISKGIDSSRISATSYGKERPAFFGSTESVMSKNRRAVTVVK